MTPRRDKNKEARTQLIFLPDLTSFWRPPYWMTFYTMFFFYFLTQGVTRKLLSTNQKARFYNVHFITSINDRHKQVLIRNLSFLRTGVSTPLGEHNGFSQVENSLLLGQVLSTSSTFHSTRKCELGLVCALHSWRPLRLNCPTMGSLSQNIEPAWPYQIF